VREDREQARHGHGQTTFQGEGSLIVRPPARPGAVVNSGTSAAPACDMPNRTSRHSVARLKLIKSVGCTEAGW
jgi:hypothetical protein